MRAVSRIRRWLRALISHESLDREMDEEMRHHLEMEAEELAGAGLSPEEAARIARIRFGGVEKHKESARDGRAVRAIESVTHDLGYVVRGLARAPAFAAAVVLSLALGIGANSTMFTILYAVILRPLPYANPGQLLGVSSTIMGEVQPVIPDLYYRSWSTTSRTLESIGWYTGLDATFSGVANPERVSGVNVTANIFPVLGTTPARGRLLMASDEDSAAAPVVLLSDALWRRHFASDSSIVGKLIQVNDQPRTVVGVLRPGQEFPPRMEFWIPWKRRVSSTSSFFGSIVARPRASASLASVQRELSQIAARVDTLLPFSIRHTRIVVMPLHDEFYGSAKASLAILCGAVLLLLLIACANVANLIFARTLNRRREFAVRVTLGATRPALVRLVLAETLALASAGAVVGTLISLWATRVFVRLSPSSISSVRGIGLNPEVFAYIAVLAAAAALVIGVAPALRASKRDPRASLGEGSAREGTGTSATRARRMLLAAQLAIAVVLLTGAGLLIRSLGRLSNVDLGFRPDHMLITDIAVPRARYTEPKARLLFDELGDHLRSTPGVREVAVGEPPLRGFSSTKTFPPTSPYAGLALTVDFVGPGYFETFGVPVREGREFAASDDSTAARVAVLNASAARILFPRGDAVGQQLAFGETGEKNETKPTVIGIVADFAQRDVAVRAKPEVFYAQRQDGGHPYTIAIRTSGAPSALAPAVRNAVRELDPALAVSRITTMDDVVASSTAPLRFSSLLLGVFAALALMLAAVGLYSVVAYGVAQRSQELGIRAALGATGRALMWLVASEMLWVVGVGLSTGLAAAWWLARVLQNLLYGTGIHDAWTFLLVPVALLIPAAIATLVPAARALRTDPLTAIKAE